MLRHRGCRHPSLVCGPETANSVEFVRKVTELSSVRCLVSGSSGRWALLLQAPKDQPQVNRQQVQLWFACLVSCDSVFDFDFGL